MVRRTAYCTSVYRLRTDFDRIIASCRKQGISHLSLHVANTGKLCGSPEELAYWRDRILGAGLTTWGEIIGNGHPSGAYYQGDAVPAPALFYEGDLVMRDSYSPDAALLPRGWQYAINEFGSPVYCTACPNEACIEGNRRVLLQLAPIFDEIWYDDEFRLDGDQGAGHIHSTAACYCDRCMADLSARLGRTVTREMVLADQKLSDAWTDQRVDKLAAMWEALCETARVINPNVRMGLMVRWGGEERDGLDIDRLHTYCGVPIYFRAGEGHFTKPEYDLPASQVIEHLVASYHVSWMPHATNVWSETTYFDGITHADIRKKVALALAAGARTIAYCPCIKAPEWICTQDFMQADDADIEAWGAALGDAACQYQPIAILRGKSAGRGDRQPIQRARDRQAFPLFGLAGLFSTVIRQGHWRDTGEQQVVAVTGRTAWDFTLEQLAGRALIVDGAALLEKAPLNDQLGIGKVSRDADGLVSFAADGFRRDGLLWCKGRVTIIPCVWQDVPELLLGALLEDIRRSVGALVPSAVVQGELGVLPVHYRHSERDAILLVNLHHEPRSIKLELKGERTHLVDNDGEALNPRMTLAADEIRLAYAVAKGIGDAA
ncbi:MAG: hypothetical protein LLG44_00075 [Chloroflexi bacterium]|nr:hypothetical protein [Chloroflexota bacterium]